MNIAISAGGSGGHIYPSLEVYRLLKKRGHNPIYIGSDNKLERAIHENENVPYLPYRLIGLKKGIFNKIRFLFYLSKAKAKIIKILKKEKVEYAIGFGGYSSLALLLACQKLKIKYSIHEQNALLGRTNKYLLKKAENIITCFEQVKGLEKCNKVKYLGNPRQFKAVNLPHDNFKVLITMGSQGSKSVNDILSGLLKLNMGIEFKLVTGKEHYIDYSFLHPHVTAYIDNMEKELQTTDLIICRGGATTISEIASMGIPSIIIPSPYVIGNHQFLNAKSFAKDWGIIIEEKNLKLQTVIEYINKIKNDHSYFYSLRTNSLKFCKGHATMNIVTLIENAKV